MTWRGIITLLLLLGALLSGWAVWNQHKKEAQPTALVGRSDYMLEQFELIALNKQGKESFTLRAPRLVRDPSVKTMDIAAPVFVIPPGEESDGGTWEVRARNGWVSADGDELRLRDDVTGTSTGRSGGPTTMKTEELNVYPEAQRAVAPGQVVISQPGSILSGRGLQLNLASKQYSFKSEVRHRYVPKTR
jgi:lipopolysaccharide export system protein LptC